MTKTRAERRSGKVASAILALACAASCGDRNEGRLDVFSAAFRPDGSIVAFSQGEIRVFDSDLRRQNTSIGAPLDMAGAGNFSHRYALSADGSLVAVSYNRWPAPPATATPPPLPGEGGPLESVVEVFDLATGEQRWALVETGGRTWAAANLALSSDGGLLAVASELWQATAPRASLRLYRLPEGTLLWQHDGAAGFVAPVFAPDRQTVFAVTNVMADAGQGGYLNAWRTSDGAVQFATATRPGINSLAVSGNGTVLVGGYGRPRRGQPDWSVWRTPDGGLLREGPPSTVETSGTDSVDVDSTGELVLTMSHGHTPDGARLEQARIRRADQPVASIQHPHIVDVGFSADARRVVTTHLADGIKVWNASDGAMIAGRELRLPLP